jgi:signal-transduction protein with cAMP-binding, CBS, and nucleotidyltransferase domain
MDAIAMFERYKATHIAVVEHGEEIGIIRADDILHTYRFNNQMMQEEKHENPFP